MSINTWDGSLQFFWIIEKEIAGSTLPYDEDDLKVIQENGIKIIVSLTASKNVAKIIENTDIKHIPMDIIDFYTPDKESVIKFIKEMVEARELKYPVLIHCYAGSGRTGTMLVLYLMIFHKYSFEESLKIVRRKRDCAVEREKQMEFLRKFELTKEMKNILEKKADY